MSTEERDTHFAGFAKLQADDICFHLRFVIPDAETREIVGMYLQKFLAHCAYDLLFFVCQHHPGEIEMSQWGGPSDEEIHRHIATLPDMTKWPDES